MEGRTIANSSLARPPFIELKKKKEIEMKNSLLNESRGTGCERRELLKTTDYRNRTRTGVGGTTEHGKEVASVLG